MAGSTSGKSSSEPKWWSWWVGTFIVVVVLASILMLVALGLFLVKPQVIVLPSSQQRAQQMNSSTQSQNPPNQTSAPPPSDLEKQVNDLKNQAAENKQQLSLATVQLEEARKQTERTEKITTAFVSFYTLLVALVVADGLLSRRRLSDALGSMEEETQKVRDELENVTKSRTEAQETLEKIQVTRKSLYAELPKFVGDRLPDVFGLNDPLDRPQNITALDEIDHLTYLANVSFRFRSPETPEERKAYIESLLATARGYLLQRKEAEVLARVEMLLKILNDSEETPEIRQMKGRAHSYAAQANYRLLVKRSRRINLQRTTELLNELNEYRKEIVANLVKARGFYPSWAQNEIIEALFRSNAPVPESVTDEQEQKKLFIQGQNDAIVIYRKVIMNYSVNDELNVVGTARQNLGCCLKRLGDEDGNYSPMFTELRSYPGENEILISFQSSSLSMEGSSARLWQKIMSDRTFFATLHPEWKADETRKRDYEKLWTGLLKRKLDFSSMEQCYNYFRGQDPGMNSWLIQPWRK